jgi:tryptophan-rich sensory protein
MAFVGVSLLAGAVGTAFIQPTLGGWYAELARPAWHPPQWLFAPVWTALYVAMGTAAWMVYRRGGDIRSAMAVFAAQLILNALWPAVFFGVKAFGPAAFVLAALWTAVAFAAVLFFRVERRAGALMVPYLAWLTFAFALNLAYWNLNA